MQGATIAVEELHTRNAIMHFSLCKDVCGFFNRRLCIRNKTSHIHDNAIVAIVMSGDFLTTLACTGDSAFSKIVTSTRQLLQRCEEADQVVGSVLLNASASLSSNNRTVENMLRSMGPFLRLHATTLEDDINKLLQAAAAPSSPSGASSSTSAAMIIEGSPPPAPLPEQQQEQPTVIFEPCAFQMDDIVGAWTKVKPKPGTSLVQEQIDHIQKTRQEFAVEYKTVVSSLEKIATQVHTMQRAVVAMMGVSLDVATRRIFTVKRTLGAEKLSQLRQNVRAALASASSPPLQAKLSEKLHILQVLLS